MCTKLFAKSMKRLCNLSIAILKSMCYNGYAERRKPDGEKIKQPTYTGGKEVFTMSVLYNYVMSQQQPRTTANFSKLDNETFAQFYAYAHSFYNILNHQSLFTDLEGQKHNYRDLLFDCHLEALTRELVNITMWGDYSCWYKKDDNTDEFWQYERAEYTGDEDVDFDFMDDYLNTTILPKLWHIKQQWLKG